jgi:hypothetical protein
MCTLYSLFEHAGHHHCSRSRTRALACSVQKSGAQPESLACAGDPVVIVPRAMLLSMEDARGNNSLLQACATVGPVEDQLFLAAHLLHEMSKGQGSRWAPYFQTLPQHTALLGTFGEEAASELQVCLT